MHLRFSALGLMAATIILLTFIADARGAIESDGAVDLGTAPLQFDNSRVLRSLLQPDGKLIISGDFTKVHGVDRRGFARLHPDGSVDTSYVPWAGLAGNVENMLLLPDGKLLACGSFKYVAPYELRPPPLIRLMSDGSVDTSFTVGRVIADGVGQDAEGFAIYPGIIYDVLRQDDGKLLVTGKFFIVYTGPGTGVSRNGIARFNADGTLDETFDPGTALSTSGEFGPSGLRLALQRVGANAGKIILIGDFESYDGHPAAAGIVRLRSDGSFDETFTSAQFGGGFVNGVLVEPDDRLVMFGSFTSVDSAPSAPVVRLTSSGPRDMSFDAGVWTNYQSTGQALTVTRQSDGKLLVGGGFHNVQGAAAHALIRLHHNGARDSSFDTSTAVGVANGSVFTILVHPQTGSIFIGGYFSSYSGLLRMGMAWLNTDGSVTNVFTGTAGATGYVPQLFALAVQPNGKIIAAGRFMSVNGESRHNIVRLNADFTVDPSFDTRGGIDSTIRSLLLQADGKILIVGIFRGVDGVARTGIARLNSDGSLDSSFDPGTGADGILSVALDSSGNIFVGGLFTTFNAQPRARLAKLTATGALDPTFDPGSGPDGSVQAIAFAPEAGGIIIGGGFENYGGTPAHRVARVNATTGALDPAFNAAAAVNSSIVSSVVRTNDAKYYIGSSSILLRLNSDGSRDNAFVNTAGGSTNGRVLALQGQKVFAIRNFSTVARLTQVGGLDPTFIPGSGINYAPDYWLSSGALNVSALTVQPDGRLLIGGIFTQYNGVQRTCLLRVTDSKLNFTAASRKTHGPAGARDINLPPFGAGGVECRRGSPDGSYQLLLNFGGAVSIQNAIVSAGIGNVANVTGSGSSVLQIELTGVADAQRITLSIGDVSTGASTTNIDVRIGFLLGDTNGDGSVNAGDALQTRGRSGQLTDGANFRSDVNVDGIVNAGDVTVVRSRAGGSLTGSGDSEKPSAR